MPDFKLQSEPLPETGQPVGLKVDTAPASRPGPTTIEGRYGRIEKLQDHHAADLWDAVRGHDDLWTYMADGPFDDADAFARFIAKRAGLADPYAFAIVDSKGRAAGYFTLLEIRPEMRVIEVGHVLYAPALKQTQLGTEAQYLLARYVFDTLGYRRYEWKCNALNAPSRRAALRYGFVFEGVFRNAIVVKGRNRDTAWYSMIDNEWPARKTAFGRWLAPDNFDVQGRQKISLGQMNGLAG
ncbi:MAG: GNAT family N-acetyltransferase [Proteobacteria bacterium]|nr:GNAT family N-acetyltransferase [Pseudomonadota bacterium]